jgi:hypothetical protein
MDDPILFPGQRGVSHMHDYFGNVTADAFSTMDTMLAGDTTCRAASDTAGYWTPTPFLGAQQLRPPVMRIYYIGTPGATVETIPPGLQMVGGNRAALSAEENPHVKWYCGRTAEDKTPVEAAPYDCSPYRSKGFVDGVIAIIDLPNCWDGAGLTPDHVAYPVGGLCPSGFGHVLPKLSERLHIGIMNPMAADGSVALRLSSGPYWTMHADFWNTWQQERLDELVDQCIAPHVHCGSIDALVRPGWTDQFGTSRYDLAYAAAPDRQGAVVAGFTNLRLPGERYHHRSDVFVRGISDGGRERWTTQFGGSGVDQALAVAVSRDDVYVAGYTDWRLPRQSHQGRSDAFVARLTAGGRVLWIRQFGTGRDDQATSIAVDGDRIFVGGSTAGTLERGGRRGGSDGFVARYTSGGAPLWVRQFGGHRDDAVRALATDGRRVFAVGWTSGGLLGPTRGGTDAFMRGYGLTGRDLWTRQYGTTGDDVLNAVATRRGEVYAAGSTTGTLHYETSAGGLDAIIGRFDKRGGPTWLRQFGSAGDDDAAAMGVADDGAYVAGSTTGALSGQTQAGESDAFAVRFFGSGVEAWTQQFGTPDYDRAYGAALDSRGMYVVGTTHGSFEGETNAGDRDVFVARLQFT